MNKKYIGLLATGIFFVVSASTTGDLLPSGVGVYSTWTPSTGSTHYTLVDESSCNGVTDYVYTTTVGNRDSYSVSLAGVPNNATITGISVTPCASRNVSNKASVMNVFYRLNGVNSADSGSYSLTGTTPTSLATANYTGLSTIKNGSTTLEVGAVLTSGTGGVRLSRLAAVITYTPLTPPLAPSNASSSYIVPGGTSTPFVSTVWIDNASNENGFIVERGIDGVNFTQVATTTPNVTYYSDRSLVSGTTYYYRITAFNLAGNSSSSNTTSVNVP